MEQRGRVSLQAEKRRDVKQILLETEGAGRTNRVLPAPVSDILPVLTHAVRAFRRAAPFRDLGQIPFDITCGARTPTYARKSLLPRLLGPTAERRTLGNSPPYKAVIARIPHDSDRNESPRSRVYNDRGIRQLTTLSRVYAGQV